LPARRLGSEGDEKVPEQREAADRAWFEYQPAEVEYDENASYPNDIKIYRKLRFGKHLELFTTDERYYRDDPTLSGLGLLELIPQWDELLKQGSPHHQYGNSRTSGVAVADLDGERIEVTFIHVSDPREDTFSVEERIRFRTAAGSRTIELL
jgi:hypothetical protein